MRAFLDVPAAQSLAKATLDDALWLERLAVRTGARGVNSDLLAAQALVAVVRRFVLQDDLASAGARLAVLGASATSDLAELERAVGSFVLATGADWAYEHVVSPATTAWDATRANVQKSVDFLQLAFDEHPPRVNRTRSKGDVIASQELSFEVDAAAVAGGRAKVEVKKEELEDGVFRITVSGEAAVLASIGVGANLMGAGAWASAEAYAGGDVTFSWDCPTEADADKLLARLAAQRGVTVLGGSVPLVGAALAAIAAGSRHIKVPIPTQGELGTFVGGAGEAAGGIGATGSVSGDGRLTRSIDSSGTVKNELTLSATAEGSAAYVRHAGPLAGFVGTGTVVVSLEQPAGALHPTSATIRLSGETGQTRGLDVAQQVEKTRTDLVMELNAASLSSDAGRKLVEAVRRGDDDEVQRLIPQIAGAKFTHETWTSSGYSTEANVEGQVFGKVGGSVSGEYESWTRVDKDEATFGYQRPAQ